MPSGSWRETMRWHLPATGPSSSDRRQSTSTNIAPARAAVRRIASAPSMPPAKTPRRRAPPGRARRRSRASSPRARRPRRRSSPGIADAVEAQLDHVGERRLPQRLRRERVEARGDVRDDDGHRPTCTAPGQARRHAGLAPRPLGRARRIPGGVPRNGKVHPPGQTGQRARSARLSGLPRPCGSRGRRSACGDVALLLASARAPRGRRRARGAGRSSRPSWWIGCAMSA